MYHTEELSKEAKALKKDTVYFETIWERAVEAGHRAVKVYAPTGELVRGSVWINIRPANSPFANWLRSKRLAGKNAYRSGITAWITIGGSIEAREAWANAVANVLNRAGYRAHVGSLAD